MMPPKSMPLMDWNKFVCNPKMQETSFYTYSHKCRRKEQESYYTNRPHGCAILAACFRYADRSVSSAQVEEIIFLRDEAVDLLHPRSELSC
jgi:hypothetical protein